MPVISVIIPTHNRAWSLERALSGVAAQDYRDFECIVVDDGSTDETRDILARFPWVRVLSTPNKGVSAARNLGAENAAGQWLAFLDSDDEWLPQKLSVQINFLQQNQEVLVCQTQETWIRNQKRHNPKKRHQKPDGEIFFRSLELCLVSPSAVMIQKRLFDELGGFWEELPACEDYDLWLRLGCRHPVRLIDEPLVIKHGGHADQLSAAPGLDTYRIKSLARLLEREPLSEDQRRAAVNVLCKKINVYGAGCKKRGRMDDYRDLMALAKAHSCIIL